MAITDGIGIECGDLQAAGGIRTILLRTWAVGDSVSYANSGTTHSITSLPGTWFTYEFKDQTPALTVTAAKENGSTSYECSLSFMMPDMDDAKSAAIQQLMSTCMMAIAIGNNGKSYVLGVSQKYANEKQVIRNQTTTSMTGAEGISGSAYNDDNGWTVTMGCKQWEAIRLYVPSGVGITLYTSGLESTTT
tara:strand:- start:1239 stop:1811 length:573 start_codon:yes stop_codon:yes gene_type:complete